MPDVYLNVTEAPAPILDRLMAALELRAADPQLRAMVTTYLTDAALPHGSRVLEVGCGTGAVTRSLAAWPAVAGAVGVDPSPVFVARARELARNLPSVTFETADGRALPFGAASFDAVVFHTTLCHVPDSLRSHGYVETTGSGFMLSRWVDMGPDALAASGRCDPTAAAELKAEARRRVARSEFFGHIAFASLIARK